MHSTGSTPPRWVFRPVEMLTLLFATGRTAGWLAQWQELLTDPEQRIARPRQIYASHSPSNYVGLDRGWHGLSAIGPTS